MINFQQNRRSQGKVLVTVTTIAAQLSGVMQVARGISLGAANAKATSARAGDKARGFQPITNFIDELASQSITMVNQINVEALQASRIAIAEFRAQEARERFNRAMELAPEGARLTGLDRQLEKVDDALVNYRKNFSVHVHTLGELLDEINNRMRAAEAITSVCRIEATNAEGYQESLGTVADDLEQAIRVIRKQVQSCSSILHETVLLRQKFVSIEH